MPKPTMYEYIERMKNPNLEGYLTGRYGSEHSIRMTKEMIKTCDGNANDALVMSELLGWYSPGEDKRIRASHEHDGEIWVVRTYAEWEEDTGINARSIERIVSRLADRGLVIKSKHKSPYHDDKVVLYVRVNWPVLFGAMGITDDSAPDDTEKTTRQTEEDE